MVYQKTCANCGCLFEARRKDTVFCSRSCKAAAAQRRYRQRQREQTQGEMEASVVELKSRWLKIIDDAKEKGVDLGLVMR